MDKQTMPVMHEAAGGISCASIVGETSEDGNKLGGRLVSIDAMRGLAALMVLAVHTVGRLANMLSFKWWGFVLYPVTLGHVGVQLFLVLSGFCIHLRLARRSVEEKDAKLDWGAFWKRRVYRLYPPYVVAVFYSVAVMLALSFWKFSNDGMGAVWAHHPGLAWDVVAHLCMLHLFSTMWVWGAGNSAFWSLALEEQLYVLYSPFVWLKRKLGLGGTVMVVAAVCLLWRAGCLYWMQSFPVNARGVDSGLEITGSIWLAQAPARWFEWCLGALAAEVYVGKVVLGKWSRTWWLSVALMCAAAWCHENRAGWLVGDLLWGGSFFVMMNAWVGVEKKNRKVFDQGWKKWVVGGLAGVGVFSYSLYLTHLPLADTAKTFSEWMGWKPGEYRFHLPLTLVAILAIPFAYGFYVVFEKPFVNGSRKQARKNDKSKTQSLTQTKTKGLVVEAGAGGLVAKGVGIAKEAA